MIQSENALLFRDVHVVAPSTGDAGDTTHVRVADGEIKEIGGGLVPRGAETVIDGAGGFLLPGLIDAHTHVISESNDHHRMAATSPYLLAAYAKRELSATLDRGFTTIRDAGGAEGGLAEAVSLGLFQGPTVFPSGLGLAQTGGQADFGLGDPVVPGGRSISRVLDGPDAVRKAVREELRDGARQIKMFVGSGNANRQPIETSHFTVEELRAAAEEAAAHNTYVMAHAYGAATIRRAVEAGIRTIEHGNLIDEETVRAIAGRAYIVPTLVTYECMLKFQNLSDRMTKQVTRVLEEGLNSLRLCRENGLRLGFGTDLEGSVRQWQWREFRLRAQVETPAEILHSAITVNAEIMGIEDTVGTIAPGYVADLLLVPRNPLEDLSVFDDAGRHLEAVVSRGRLHKCTREVLA